jgi:shikimate kinase
MEIYAKSPAAAMETDPDGPGRPDGGPSLLFLIGARAAGKTTCGRALAQGLGLPFFDTDSLVRERAGLCVAQIVEREGWAGFRRRESAALRSLAPGLAGAGRSLAGVVATGGGLILDPANRELLRRHGLVVFLDAPPEVLAARLAAAPEAAQRPALGGGKQSLLDEARAGLAARRALYLAAAHQVLDAARPLREVLAELRNLCA